MVRGWMMSGSGGALPAGAKLADYQIEGVLGEPGGFGVTYRARDVRLEREVAIKEYFPQAFAKRRRNGVVAARDAASEQVFGWGLERFVEEARSLAKFSHPNIVRVLRLIEDENGTAYIVMEMVRGDTLEALVERDGPMTEEQFRPIFDQLLSGCDAIHGIGIIHRDIKPSNIIVRENGDAVLIDFGAARDLALERRKGFTAAIVADGYSPPEQYSMKAQQDARSDIYALAATAYFAHTGEGPTPASARAGGDEMAAAATEAAGRGRPAYLRALDHALCLKADERPRTVAEWRAELAPPAQRVDTVRTLDRRGVFAIAGGAAILAGVSAVLALGRGGGGTEKALIDGRARPLKIAWSTDLAAVAGIPFSSITAAAQGAILAGQQIVAGEQVEMLALRLSDSGQILNRWMSGEAGSAAKAAWPLPDGGALIGGDFNGGAEAAVIRLDPAWNIVARHSLGPGSVSCFLESASGIAVGLEGGDGTGLAKLVRLDAEGSPAAEIRLIDQATDSVQKATFLDGGDIAVLGRRLRGDGKAGSQLWVARLTSDGEGVWRKQVAGLGITSGWAIASAGQDIFVAGTTRSDAPDAPPKRILIRFSGDGREIWSKIDEGSRPTSGRALAVLPGRRPALYVGGSDVGPAYIAQVDGDGNLPWRASPAPLVPGEELVTVESLSFRRDGSGFASAFVQGSGGMKRLVALGLIA